MLRILNKRCKPVQLVVSPCHVVAGRFQNGTLHGLDRDRQKLHRQCSDAVQRGELRVPIVHKVHEHLVTIHDLAHLGSVPLPITAVCRHTGTPTDHALFSQATRGVPHGHLEVIHDGVQDFGQLQWLTKEAARRLHMAHKHVQPSPQVVNELLVTRERCLSAVARGSRRVLGGNAGTLVVS